MKKHIEHLQKGEDVQNIFCLENGMLKRTLKSGLSVLMVPLLLIPFVIAESHWTSHSGAKKLSALIKLQ